MPLDASARAVCKDVAVGENAANAGAEVAVALAARQIADGSNRARSTAGDWLLAVRVADEPRGALFALRAIDQAAATFARARRVVAHTVAAAGAIAGAAQQGVAVRVSVVRR